MKDAKEKKVFGFGVKFRILADMQAEGYTDINDYIDALKERLNDCEKQKSDFMQVIDAYKQKEAAPAPDTPEATK